MSKEQSRKHRVEFRIGQRATTVTVSLKTGEHRYRSHDRHRTEIIDVDPESVVVSGWWLPVAGEECEYDDN